jgi:hypothetical protein
MKALMSTDKFNLLIMVVSILILTISAGVLRFSEKKYDNKGECFK